MKKKKAYTLIELLTIVAVLGILVVALIVGINFSIDKARTTGVQTDLRSFQLALEAVATDHAGFSTFGWDTGDVNGDRIMNAYDLGDANQNGVIDAGEHWSNLTIHSESWTGRYTLVNPADPDDDSAVRALEAAINKKLDTRLHISISNRQDGYVIRMARAARDPWKVEYHGQYVEGEGENLDRGAIVMYSNGVNRSFGSEAFIRDGVAMVAIPGGDKKGQDDLSIAVTYSLRAGHGEILTDSFGFPGGTMAMHSPSYEEREFAVGRVEFADGTILNWEELLSADAGDLYGYDNDGISVTQIKANAFKNCTSLVSITIPSGVDVIGNFAFRGCTNLVSVKIPDTVTNLGKGVFWDTGLVTVRLPGGITELSQETFRNCSKLSHVVIPDGVETIGIYAFSGCSALESVSLPRTTKTIGTNAFFNCKKLKSISLPEGTQSIGANAFKGCLELNSVFLPNSVTSIGNGAFWNCSFSSINIPSGLTSIPQEAFRACKNLTTIVLHDGISSIGIYAFSECDKLKTVQFSDSLTTIGESAFQNCSALVRADLPDGLISIGNNAFKKCTAMISVTLPDTISTIGEGAFWNCAFSEVHIPSSISVISQEAFRACNNLESVVIPDGVTDIGRYSFADCEKLKLVSLPDTLVSIQDNAFRMSTALQEIRYAGRVTQWSLVSRGTEWDYGIPCNRVICTNGEAAI